MMKEITVSLLDHHGAVLSSMATARKEKTMCDIIFIVEGRTFVAHKLLLAMCSDYFKAMFTCSFSESNKCSNMSDESNNDEITIHSITSAVFSDILDYFYEGKIKLSMFSVVDLLHAASLFLLKDLKFECFRYLENGLNASNCIKIKNIANMFSESNLLSVCNEFIRKNFQSIINSNEIINVEFSDLRSLLLSDAIESRDEDSIAVLVEKWLDVRAGQLHKRELQLLFKLIRLKFISKQAMEHLFSFAKDLDLKIASNKHLPVLKYENYLQKRKRKSINRRTSQKVSSVVTCVNSNGSFCYNMKSQQLRALDRFPGKLTFVTCVCDNTLYALEAVIGKSLYCYDVETGKWKKLASMVHTRCNYATASLNNKIYVIGGSRHFGMVPTSECYDPLTNVWSTISSTNYDRFNSSAVASKKFVYIIGGGIYNFGSGQNLNLEKTLVERYCPNKDSWETLPKMHQEHDKTCGAAVFYNNMIYVFSGSTTKFEFWDESKSLWTVVSTVAPILIFDAFVMRNFIIVISDDNSVYKYYVTKHRPDRWVLQEDFIHSDHQMHQFNYAVISMSNFDFFRKPERYCKCKFLLDFDEDAFLLVDSSDETDSEDHL